MVTGRGKHFCAGIDLEALQGQFAAQQHECAGRARHTLRTFILELQASPARSKRRTLRFRCAVLLLCCHPAQPACPRASLRPFPPQAAMTAFEECVCPVIAAVHGACVGAGVDLITACDLRLATADALFTVKVPSGVAAGM